MWTDRRTDIHEEANSRFRNFANAPKSMSGKILDFSLSQIMKELGIITTIFRLLLLLLSLLIRFFCYRYLDYAG